MIIVGLTGSIAMGKSTAAQLFRRQHIPVFDADKAVHLLLARKGAGVEKVAQLFPGTLEEGVVNRKKLGKIVFNDAKALQALEHILHPLVREMHGKFIRQARRQGRRMAVLEIPLLFEVGAQQHYDKVVTVTASPFMQAKRALARPGMTKEKLASILKRQTPDAKKRRLTDYLVYTGLGKSLTSRQINAIIKELLCVK